MSPLFSRVEKHYIHSTVTRTSLCYAFLSPKCPLSSPPAYLQTMSFWTTFLNRKTKQKRASKKKDLGGGRKANLNVTKLMEQCWKICDKGNSKTFKCVESFIKPCTDLELWARILSFVLHIGRERRSKGLKKLECGAEKDAFVTHFILRLRLLPNIHFPVELPRLNQISP